MHDIPGPTYISEEPVACEQSPASQPTQPSKPKRGKFSEEQDFVLLYAITRLAPYAADHGDVG
ncbi:hypothetical protein GN244_ATG08745 [Phytophthora infestans]|uniref:Uncharacterized protein n=1 Tax=Phytophthora infestans TaxID=4787 RepID=A0A833SUX3_PHYIN|nr:hypothetical protein GN244_ATG08745 [Phytophthora infestans]KAF4144801.1 hypothetical protein GN958_ATG05969 [Phytophthora infestans]